MLRSFNVISNVICTNHTIKKLRSRALGLSIIALLFLSSCMSLDYVSGIYEQNPDQQVDVLVRVKNQRGKAMTDLVLNDFYVRHNNQVLERKNNLRLNEDLSAVKLYLVILIDQRKNDQLKYDFERTRQAVKAYLTLQSPNTYIKIISYDREAHALNAEFSNDKDMLRGLISQLNTVQMETPETALSGALAMAEESIEALPYGSYILDPQKFTAEQVRNAKGPLLYNSAILLMNHNRITAQDLAPYSNNYNFIVLDSTRSMSDGLQANTLPPEQQYAAESNAGGYGEPQAELVASQTKAEYRKMPTIFETYELPPTDLNINSNQSVAVDFVDQVWDSLANIVNGYYWLSYNKYTDLHIGETRRVAVSLTQYGRSQDSGELGDYANLAVAENSMSDSADSAEDTSVFGAVAMTEPTANVEEADLLPPAITEEDSVSNLASNHYDAELLSLLPGRYFASYEKPAAPSAVIAAVEEQNDAGDLSEADETDVVDDFEILTELDSDNDELLVSNDDSPAPQYTATPIPLVGKESVPVADVPVVEHPMASISASPSVFPSRAPSEFPSEPMFEDDPALKPFTTGHYIQVGAFTKLENLYNTIESLSGKYDVRAVSSVINGREYNRCIIGPFKDKAETERVHNELKASSRLSDAFIIRKPIEEWIGK